ncbi:putative ester cyclase [Frondihabitans sp. PhB188]|uniref:ester cyclase n=1 Tax=Frondihabitans sp. PhB188 TaxID=2485200 RepID=UPI000F489E7C|nr:ester cyclase [Frondihabitans sp. PhB188]ROQ37006.1 putative ester cyclase [Frondihabitans sp. PhB188]
MAKETNIATQQKLGDIITAREVSRLGEAFHADVVDHDPAPDASAGLAGIQEFWSSFLEAFPDLDLSVETLVADDEQVTAVFTIHGTHTGPFQGAEPTGKSFTVRGIQVAKFNDEGLIVERWGATDEAGLQKQLGLDS